LVMKIELEKLQSYRIERGDLERARNEDQK
jgi:hypothetical protein